VAVKLGIVLNSPRITLLLGYNNRFSINYKRKTVITSGQIRAGRALLRWSAQELADHSSVGIATVLRLEQQDGVPSGRSHTLLELQKALETAGVEFIGTPEDAPGVRLVKQPKRNIHR
jgi:hypothetical protein